MIAALLILLLGSPQNCGGGTITTTFSSNGGFAGSMFDLAPSVDLEITCLDVNWSTAGSSIDVMTWWCPDTVVGNDQNQLGTWLPFATGSATAAGFDLPTCVVLTPLGTNPVFHAGVTYGIYVQISNYASASGSLRYTNIPQPTAYAGTHGVLTAYYGKADGLQSGTFAYRAWNGTLYTEASVGLQYRHLGICPGSGSLEVRGATPAGRIHVLIGAAGASVVPPGRPCAGTPLALSSPRRGVTLIADHRGRAAIIVILPPAACGRSSLVLDEISCRTSAVLQF